MPDSPTPYRTLKALYDELDIPIEQEEEFTVHRLEDVHAEPMQSPVFRANYYTFLLIASGQGKYTLDGQEFTTRPLTLYFTNPGHLKSFQTSEPYRGFIITFSEAFLKAKVHPGVLDDFPFLLAELVPPSYLSAEEYEPLATLAEQIYQESRRESTYRYQIVANLFVAFLLKVKERDWSTFRAEDEADRAAGIVNVFRQNLERTFRSLEQHEHLPNVQDYAQWQQLHPNYFNTVIKAKTGQSAHAWIADKTLAEAEALLTKTALPVKSIAHQLKFSEPTHFGKFFKKHRGETPAAFRKKRRS